MTWTKTGELEPSAFEATRIELHYAAWVLASAAHSLLPRESDDSHSNLGMDVDRGMLWTHALSSGWEIGMDLLSLRLVLRQGSSDIESTDLPARSVDEGLQWISDALGRHGIRAAIERRAYPDFPESPLIGGGRFTGAGEAERRTLGAWFANAQRAFDAFGSLEPQMSAPRVWPHHFDLGALISFADDGSQSIGLGFSPGDAHFDEPYFYCSPYPAPGANTAFATLPFGHWTSNGFTSAVLTASELSPAESPADAVNEYLTSAVAQCRHLLNGST